MLEGTLVYEDSPFISCSDFICFVISSDLMMGHSKRSLKDVVLAVVVAKALKLQVLYTPKVPPPVLGDFVDVVK